MIFIKYYRKHRLAIIFILRCFMQSRKKSFIKNISLFIFLILMVAIFFKITGLYTKYSSSMYMVMGGVIAIFVSKFMNNI